MRSAETAHRELVRRLHGLRRKEAAARCLFGVGLTLACGIGAGFALLLLESGFYLRPAAKLLLEGLLGAVLAVLAVRACLHPLLRAPSLEETALSVERRFGGLHQRLISALQLWERRGSDGASAEMIGAAVEQAGEVATGLDFEVLIDRFRPLRMAGLCGAAALIVLGAFGLWPAPLWDAAGRLGHPRTAYVRPPDTHIALRPGDAVLVAGDPFEIAADLSGVVPTQVRLSTREEGANVWTAIDLPVRRARSAHRFGAVTRSFAYRLRANDAETPAFSVTVQPRPMVTRIRHHYRYPAYTRLGERQDQEGGDIVAPIGTAAALQIASSLPLQEAWLDFEGGERLPARVEGRFARVELSVTEDRRYTVGLLGVNRVRNRDPVEYRIVALQDRPPEVRLLRPGADSELGETMRIALLAEAHDDFGISRLEVRYRVNDEGEDLLFPVPADTADAAELMQEAVWDLSDIGILPGDRVLYRMRAYDNNTVSGPAFGESATFTVRFPSLFEIHQEAQRAQQEGQEQMASVREAGEELRKRLEKVARELMVEEKLDWQERKELETAIEDQARIGERMEGALKKLDEALDRLEESGLMADETLEKLDEMQELLSQIETPELKRAMEALREALEDADPEEVQAALSEFRSQQEAFLKNLDRTIALLKRLRQEQALDALVREMEALAAEQEEIVRSLQQEGAPQRLAEREDLLRRDTERLRGEMARSAEEMAEGGPTGEALDRISDELEKRQVADRMAQVGRDLRADRADPAQKRGAGIAADLRELSRQLAEARDAFIAGQKAEITRELNRMLHDLLALSQAQERTARRAEAGAPGADLSPLSLDQARNLSRAGRMAEGVLRASEKTFFVTPQAGAALGEALRKMQEAAGNLQNGNAPGAARSGRAAMGALNLTAMMVRQALADLAQAGSAVGLEEMLQRMGQLAGEQGELNAQTEGLFGQQRPGGFSPGQRMSLARMAAQQRAIQQALEALRQQMAGRSGRMLGDLGRIASEMEEVAKELRRGRATRQTVERQRQILSRMLDAQRSVRQRGWTKQREARRGKDAAYRGPGSLPPDLGEADNPLRRRLRDALDAGYPAEYQALIRRYFERLIQDALAGGENGK